MKTLTRARAPQRVLFYGMRCAFSVPPLEALIDAGHQIAGVVLPGPSFGPPILKQPSTPLLRLSTGDQNTSDIDHLADRVSTPIYSLGNLQHTETVDTLTALAPDLIVVSCFPLLLPLEILDIPCLGGV